MADLNRRRQMRLLLFWQSFSGLSLSLSLFLKMLRLITFDNSEETPKKCL